MKKIILLIICILCLCGCSNLNKENIDSVVADTSVTNMTNQYRTGYKYYLPVNMKSIYSNKLNEVITDSNNKYYLYVDLVSYFEKQDISFTENSNYYYSKPLNIDNNKGFLEISVKNDKYLIEIMYNYAKIEVMVDEDNINEAVANSLVILTSIRYNDDIIKNMIGEDILNYSEEKFTIFDSTVEDSNFLEYVQEYDNYNEEENEVPDYDLIN